MNAGRHCHEWCVPWTGVVMGKEKNSIIGKNKGGNLQVFTCYLQLSVSMGKTPTFGPCGVLCLVI